MERLVLSWVGKPVAYELMPGLNRVGRNPTNDCRVPDASLSSFHCEITLNPDNTLRVRDLASTNGTFVDGLQVMDSEVKPGEILRMGSVEFALERVTVAEPQPVLAGNASESAESWTHDESDVKAKGLFGKLTQTLKITFKR
jgi:pSer/pThr/pTyr-binding forkhead associated (FHA) protein